MHRALLHALVAAAIGALACAPSGAPDAVEAPPIGRPQAAHGPRPAERIIDAHACTRDDECVNSCSQGAVNRGWYALMFPGGEACEDGCAGKGIEAPRCEAGGCVAYADGEREPQCTRRAVIREPQRPGPAHRCRRDDECRLSCAFGAVNTGWYALSPRQECRDGCASKGMAVRCEDGRCLALRHDVPDPPCTERSIHGDGE